MLYFRILYIIVQTIISFLIYITLKKELPSWVSYIISIMYFTFTPHFISFTYKSLSSWFATLLILCLINHERTRSKLYLVLMALFLCLGTLCYPTLGILYFTTVFILSKYEKKSILIFTIICFAIALLFLTFLLITLKPNEIISNITNVLEDEAHQESILVT